MSYITAIIGLFLALFGAFYKDTQKKEDGNAVYWHGFPVLTPLGWILVLGLLGSFAFSIYGAYGNAKKAAEQQARADALQTTLAEVRSTSAYSLAYQIDRFKAILDNQDKVGKTTLDSISDSSTTLKDNINKSSGLLNTNINDSSNILRSNITESSHLLRGEIDNSSALLRQDVVEVSLANRKSIPQLYWFTEKAGAVQSFTDAMTEEYEAKDKVAPPFVNHSIGFMPKSIRDVLFPYADNTTDYDSNISIGEIFFTLGDFDAGYEVKPTGFVNKSLYLNKNSIVSMESRINGADTKPHDAFALIFNFEKEWSWEELNDAFKTKFREGKPVIIIHRYQVPTQPFQPPSFTQMTLVAILSEHPRFHIFMPLEIESYSYDARGKWYVYKLRLAKAPEIITEQR